MKTLSIANLHATFIFISMEVELSDLTLSSISCYKNFMWHMLPSMLFFPNHILEPLILLLQLDVTKLHLCARSEERKQCY